MRGFLSLEVVDLKIVVMMMFGVWLVKISFILIIMRDGYVVG